MKQTMYTKKEVLTGVLVIALVLLLAAGLFCGQSALLFAITLIASITFGIYFLVELFLPETRHTRTANRLSLLYLPLPT